MASSFTGEVAALLALSLATLAAASCTNPTGGTDIGNGRVGVQLQLRGFDGRAVPRSLELSSGDRVDEAMLAVEKLRLRPGTTCEDDDEGEEDERVDAEGPFVADLVGDGIAGGPASFEVDEGSFCRLRLDLHASEALAGAAIVLRGARADGTPFEVRSEEGDEIDLRAGSAAFTLEEGGSALVLAFDLGAWVEALDLASLTAGADGTIRITKDADDEVLGQALERFEEAVKESARLARDEDADTELDEEDETVAD